MKPFSRNEIIAASAIILVIFAVTLINMSWALRRARDAQRMQDLGAISEALHNYQKDFGFFPPSENGKIKACKNSNFDEIADLLKKEKEFNKTLFISGLTTCEWGKDKLADVNDESYPAYLSIIPQDPKAKEKVAYYYISNSERFQLYSYLEGENSEEGYNLGIVDRSLSCGNKICSFGKSYGETPLNISIEEYEQELLEIQKGGNKQ